MRGIHKRKEWRNGARDTDDWVGPMHFSEKFDALTEVSTNSYYFIICGISLASAAMLINLDFHYVIGGIVMLIALITVAASVGFAFAEYAVLDRGDLKGLYELRVINFWVMRLIVFAVVPFFLWVVVLMFTRSGTVTPTPAPIG